VGKGGGGRKDMPAYITTKFQSSHFTADHKSRIFAGAHEAQERIQAPLQTNLLAASSHAQEVKEWYYWQGSADDDQGGSLPISSEPSGMGGREFHRGALLETPSG